MPTCKKRVTFLGNLKRFSCFPYLISIGTALFLFSGCSSWGGHTDRLENVVLPDPAHLYNKILNTSGKVKSLKGAARIHIRAEERRTRPEAVIACDRSGRLRFEVFDFLGHVVFLAFIRDQSFFAYSVSDNRYLEEAAGAGTLRGILGVSLTGGELIALILGSPFFVPLESPVLHVQSDRGSILLRASHEESGVGYRVRVDPQGRAIQSILTTQTGNRAQPETLQVDFGRYKQVNGIEFPHRIRVAEPGGEAFFEIIYQKIVLNEDLQEELFRFVPPEDAEEMTW